MFLGQASMGIKNDLQKKEKIFYGKKKTSWNIQQKYKGKSVNFF